MTTKHPNGLTGTDTSPGVWLHNKPTDLSVCVSKEGEYEGGVGEKLNSEKMWYVLRRSVTFSMPLDDLGPRPCLVTTVIFSDRGVQNVCRYVVVPTECLFDIFNSTLRGGMGQGVW